MVGGFVLLVLEIATPGGFFVMFFGLGALTVGVLSGLGVVNAEWIRWLLFTVFSLGYLLVFRSKIQRRFQMPPGPAIDSLVGVLAIPQDTIEPGAVGKVEVRGSSWSARNLAPAAIVAGERCTVVDVDEGLLLGVRPE